VSVAHILSYPSILTAARFPMPSPSLLPSSHLTGVIWVSISTFYYPSPLIAAPPLPSPSLPFASLPSRLEREAAALRSKLTPQYLEYVLIQVGTEGESMGGMLQCPPEYPSTRVR
jgi:hypothetical protein